MEWRNGKIGKVAAIIAMLNLLTKKSGLVQCFPNVLFPAKVNYD
jgi:hypothetical protein